MAETRSVAEMSRETGIPYRTLLRVKAGGEMPSAYRTEAQNLYGRETYARLRVVGTPIQEATRLRGGVLDRVKQTESLIKQKVDFWAEGSYLMSFRKQMGNVLSPAEQGFLESVKEKIRRSLSKSVLTTEEISYGNVS